MKQHNADLGLITKRLLSGKFRFILSTLFFVVLKIASAFWLFRRMGERDFISVFHGWDSFYYMNIASSGYPNEVSADWAFFPLYPYCSRIVNLVVHDVWLSTALISFIAGILWIPFYQSIAERYMSVGESFVSTCMFALFPQVFLFSTVAYSEAVFLLTTLIAWWFYLRKNIFGACISACFATLTRPYGILIVLPIFLGVFRRRSMKKTSLISLPIATLLGWIWYNLIKTGDFAFLASQKHWIEYPWQPNNWIRELLIPTFGIKGASLSITPLAAYIFLVPFVALTAFLVIKSFEIDWRLGAYGAAVLVILLFFGTPLSAPRFLPFIFPIWLNIKTRNAFTAFLICIFFYLHSLVVWFLFSNNIWVG